MPCRKQAHSSTKSAAEYWVPASAGMTEERAAMLCQRALERPDKPVKRTVVYCELESRCGSISLFKHRTENRFALFDPML